MTSRKLFLSTLKAENFSGRPPIWVMRQAGRYLPEYRALKKKYTFLEMVKSPDLATEVTLQPLQRFQLDAAIVFSDILVIPEAMGQGYEFRDGGGIEMSTKLQNDTDIKNLSSHGMGEKLSYVSETLQILRNELDEKLALLGFCGSPWTLACYMIEGGSAEGFPKALSWAKNQPGSFESLLEKITIALIDYIKMQAKCGVDAIQIFDSWNSLCPPDKLWDFSLKWIAQIIEQFDQQLNLIVYSSASENGLKQISQTGVGALGINQYVSLSQIRKILPTPLVVQGNLPPEIMETTPEKVTCQALSLLESMKGDPAHIFNLGHGIRPGAKVECMEALVSTVRNFQLKA